MELQQAQELACYKKLKETVIYTLEFELQDKNVVIETMNDLLQKYFGNGKISQKKGAQNVLLRKRRTLQTKVQKPSEN